MIDNPFFRYLKKEFEAHPYFFLLCIVIPIVVSFIWATLFHQDDWTHWVLTLTGSALAFIAFFVGIALTLLGLEIIRAKKKKEITQQTYTKAIKAYLSIFFLDFILFVISLLLINIDN